MSEPRLILASGSPRRHELLRLLELPFEVVVADLDEAPRADETPVELVTRLSRAKAVGVAQRHHRGLVIACDTIVVLQNSHDGARVLGKPCDRKEAETMLRQLRGRSHLVYSAVTIMDRLGNTTTELAETRLTMRYYTEAELAAYVASGDPLDKAGAYAIQHEGFHPVQDIEGCYANVMGLPLCHVARSLRTRGWAVATDVPAACQAHTGRRCNIYLETIQP